MLNVQLWGADTDMVSLSPVAQPPPPLLKGRPWWCPVRFNPQYPAGSAGSLAAAVFQGVEGGWDGEGGDSRRLLRTDGVYVHTLLLKTLLVSFAEAWFCREGTRGPRVKCRGGWMLERNIAAGLPSQALSFRGEPAWRSRRSGSPSAGFPVPLRGGQSPLLNTHTWTRQPWRFYLQNRKALYSKTSVNRKPRIQTPH